MGFFFAKYTTTSNSLSDQASSTHIMVSWLEARFLRRMNTLKFLSGMKMKIHSSCPTDPPPFFNINNGLAWLHRRSSQYLQLKILTSVKFTARGKQGPYSRGEQEMQIFLRAFVVYGKLVWSKIAVFEWTVSFEWIVKK